MSGRGRLRGGSLGLWLALALLAAPAGAQPQPAKPDAEARKWIDLLDRGDAAERVRALEELASLGERARLALEEATRHASPDVRFHALWLLRAPEGALERNLRRIAFGGGGKPGATYAPAFKAYEAFRRQATPGTRSQLLRIARRMAPKDQPRLVIVALDLWEELARGAKVSSGEAQLLAELLALELGKAKDDLLEAFGALPPNQRVSALRGALVDTERSAIVARAARVLGETCEPEQSVEARRLLLLLLDHREAEVRLQALYSLGLIGQGGEQARLRVARACRDLDARVAEVALRLTGEWKLLLARSAAEQVASDVNRPLETRREAIRTLGLLGDPAAIPTLRRLMDLGSELGLHAIWALAALDAPGIDVTLRERLQSEDGATTPLYYRALARLGAKGRAVLLAYVQPKAPLPTGRALELLDLRTRQALEAYPYLDHPQAAADLVKVIRGASGQALRDRIRAKLAAENLALRRDAPSIEATVNLLLEPPRIDVESELLLGVVRHGAPLHQRKQLSSLLERYLPQLRGFGGLRGRTLHARALLRVDPLAGRSRLGPFLRRGVRDAQTHDLTWDLARAGDAGPVRSQALPFARMQLENLDRDEARFGWQNRLALDYLYAGDLKRARLELLRNHWTLPHWHKDTVGYNLACVAAAEADPTRALRLLRRVVRYHYNDPELVRYDRDLGPLASDTRFQRLVEQLELAKETALRPPILELPWQNKN